MGDRRVFPDAGALAEAAAEELVVLAGLAMARAGRFTVALAGGSTPLRLYRLLARPPYRERVDWGRVEWFWGDERPVPPGHPESNYGAAREALLGPLGVPDARVHRIEAERSDRGAAACEYAAEIARVTGVEPGGYPPALDLVLLGMGADGHTASLFPWSPALWERRRWVVAQFVPALGTDRVTVTPPILNRAREVRVLVAGADKAATLRAVQAEPAEPERYPVQLIRPAEGRLVWLVDAAASS
jgi:6-phosphogluconolactonase